MHEKILDFLQKKPLLYTKSTAPFWDDNHISKGMLAAHLNPNIEGASRKHDFIKKSVDWIAEICNTQDGNKLLDLGCGPGIYADKLYNIGFAVTGIDYSRRSIDYATKQAKMNHADIKYIYQKHLGFAISSIGTIPRTSKRSGYTHSLTCNLSSNSSQVITLCGNPTVKCFSS